MVAMHVIEQWKNAPRLTLLAAFFERTASGLGGAPDRAVPTVDLGLLDFDFECSVFSDTHRSLWGPFDKHYFASIPYRLEEECRIGASLLAFGLRNWARTRAPTNIYTLGTGTGCLARTLATLGGGRIETLCCSPTEANRTAFYAKRSSPHAHFFHGPFFDLDDERYATDPQLQQFRDGFDILMEDTTFQMYDRDRLSQLDFIAPRLRPGGLLVQVQKLANHDVELYQERERQKDDLFKSRYFSSARISDKRDEVLNTMDDLQVDLETTTAALGAFFRYSVAIWNSGNFYTIVSSNARQAILDFTSLIIQPAIPPAYCNHVLPLVLNETEAQPLGTALKWRSSHSMTEALPRLLAS
ncbi:MULTISPECIES: class I SAM-dependent methyltransferase [unclassified Rhizobium]|uniref:class I SAM-dependent methyltransferase n=1 Tax=unclassified Rhizobium TaxID=2613769 RepID=UPI0017826C1D|nr:MULTISPECIES: class I SAM-dependent methyltransferase [unclassified Rhizobium]MBD8689482.1 class I SAM-dependent methyltransferase [Rhizobium sp. CFBP 13644]MBD8693996.1 class I SAM-dependent methyltransferase [Rhizobium sp. CFBP 13717]